MVLTVQMMCLVQKQKRTHFYNLKIYKEDSSNYTNVKTDISHSADSCGTLLNLNACILAL